MASTGRRFPRGLTLAGTVLGALVAIGTLVSQWANLVGWVYGWFERPEALVREITLTEAGRDAYHYRIIFTLANATSEPILINAVQLREGTMQVYVARKLPPGALGSTQVERRVDRVTLHVVRAFATEPETPEASGRTRIRRLFGKERIQMAAREQVDHVLMVELLPPPVLDTEELHGFNKEIVLEMDWEWPAKPGKEKHLQTTLVLSDKGGKVQSWWERWWF